MNNNNLFVTFLKANVKISLHLFTIQYISSKNFIQKQNVLSIVMIIVNMVERDSKA